MMTSINNLPAVPLQVYPPKEVQLAPETEKTGSFGETLKEFVSDVNKMQVTADEKTKKFATGEIKDLHEVMAAAEEAGLSLQLLIELRNKALDAYRELMRTQV